MKVESQKRFHLACIMRLETLTVIKTAIQPTGNPTFFLMSKTKTQKANKPQTLLPSYNVYLSGYSCVNRNSVNLKNVKMFGL